MLGGAWSAWGVLEKPEGEGEYQMESCPTLSVLCCGVLAHGDSRLRPVDMWCPRLKLSEAALGVCGVRHCRRAVMAESWVDHFLCYEKVVRPP